MKMTKRSTKSALLLSALAMLMCVAMLVGTTFAWFTDSVSSAGNVIKSGNLDLDVQYTLDGETWADLSGANDLFQKGLWEPGHTEVVALRIENKGTLALKYVANMNILNETIGKSQAGDDIVLSDILQVATVVQEANMIGDILLSLVFGGSQNTDPGSFTSFKDASVLQGSKELLPGSAHYAIVTVTMPSSVGNEANHDGINVPSIEFGINVFATQYTYESGSFGPLYDADAWAGTIDTSWYDSAATEMTIDSTDDLAGLAKLVNTGVDNFAGKTVKLSSDIDLNGYSWFQIGTSSTYPFAGNFDGNGKTISNLYIQTKSSYAGLFGYVASGASISNLNMVNVTVDDLSATADGTYSFGAVVGYCPGSVKLDNVTLSGNIQIGSETGGMYTGALVGRSKAAKITNCSVVGADGSYVASNRWAAGIVGYDNGAVAISGCSVENLDLIAKSYVGGISALGAANAKIKDNSVKNVNVILNGASESDVMTYGTVVGGVSVYSYSTAPVYVSNNTVENVTATVNGVDVTLQEIGSKYADGTDLGLIVLPSIKVGDGYYTYMTKAVAAAPKDGTEYVIELTGDTIINAKFKPSVAKNQNIVLKTNGYNLIWAEMDSSKNLITDANGGLVTVIVDATNVSSYVKVAAGGSFVIE